MIEVSDGLKKKYFHDNCPMINKDANTCMLSFVFINGESKQIDDLNSTSGLPKSRLEDQHSSF